VFRVQEGCCPSFAKHSAAVSHGCCCCMLYKAAVSYAVMQQLCSVNSTGQVSCGGHFVNCTAASAGVCVWGGGGLRRLHEVEH